MIYTFIHSMVVKTRSYYYSKQEEEQQQKQERESSSPSCSADSIINITTSVAGGGRRVRITTPSFREASTRSYKVYTPTIKPKHRRNNKEREEAEAAAEEEAEEKALEAEAIEALLTLQQDADYACESSSPIDEFESETMSSGSSIRSGFEMSMKHTCMNPMNPITTYMYRICVYNIERTAHLKTAYILYNPKSRLFHVHTIISNQIDHYAVAEEEPRVGDEASAAASAVWALPEPKNTLQMKFTSFVGETIVNYVMSLIIPSKEYDYYIQDDIIGLVSSNSCDTADTVFGEDSSFYDIERQLYDQSCTLTINGFKAFMLLPSRKFWCSSDHYSTSGSNNDNHYTYHALDSVLLILGQSH